MQAETRTHLQIVSIIVVKLQLELKTVDKFHQTTQMLKLMGEVSLTVVMNVEKIVGFMKSIPSMFKDLTVAMSRFFTDGKLL